MQDLGLLLMWYFATLNILIIKYDMYEILQMLDILKNISAAIEWTDAASEPARL